MTVKTCLLAIAAGSALLAGCGPSDEQRRAPQRESASSRAPAGAPKSEVSRRIQTRVELVTPGRRVTLLPFAGVGRLEATCGERSEVAFRVEDKSAAVGVDTGRRRGKVQTLDPGERLRTRLARSALQRWHIGSRHGDGHRVVTASVEVTPVVGGRGSCMFTAQSIRTGRAPPVRGLARERARVGRPLGGAGRRDGGPAW
jgi:hypothetical protein